METARANPTWREALAWLACIIHGRMRSGTQIRVDSSLSRRTARPLGVSGPAAGAGLISTPTEESRRHPCGGVLCRSKHGFPTEGAVCGMKYERGNHHGRPKVLPATPYVKALVRWAAGKSYQSPTPTTPLTLSPLERRDLQVQTGYTGRRVTSTLFQFMVAQGEYLSDS